LHFAQMLLAFWFIHGRGNTWKLFLFYRN